MGQVGQKLVGGVGLVVELCIVVDVAGRDHNEVVVVVEVEEAVRIAEVGVGKVEFVDTMGYNLDYLV